MPDFSSAMTQLSRYELERLAHKRAGAKLGWYVHAVVYAVVNLILFAISEFGFGSRSWPVYALLGWGLGLLLHGISAFLLGAGNGFQDRLVKKERDNLQRQRDGS